MREALARMDGDLVVRERPRPRRKPAPGRLRALIEPLLRKPGRTLCTVAFLAILGGVLVNALFLQGRRHPSPLFHGARDRIVHLGDRHVGSRAQGVGDQVGKTEALLPPARPADLAVSPGDTRTQASANKPSADPIGELIRAGEQRAEPSRQVMAAQRALAKLNYGPLKPDGFMGPGTRSAIERFEKDRGLPVGGELNPRVTKALAAAAGIPIE